MAVGAGLLVAVGGLGACTDDDAGDQVIDDPSTTATPTSADDGDDGDDGDGDGGDEVTSTSPSTTAAPTSAPSTTAVAPTPSTTPFDGATARVELPIPAATQEVVSHTTLGVTATGDEVRTTFGFDGALPGIVVEYVERPVRASGSGDEVAVDGGAVLAIRFEPASSATLDGEDVVRTYEGPDRVEGAGSTLTEVVRTGDFEAVYEWVVGLTTEVPFRVEVDEAASTVTMVVPAR